MFAVERNLRGHHGAVTSLAFSPNMKQLVSSGADKSLILWGLQQKMKGYRYANFFCAQFMQSKSVGHDQSCSFLT